MGKVYTCGELRLKDAGKTVTLMGWVHRKRSFGGLTFIDLRDRWGIVQCVLNPQISDDAHAVAEDTRVEYVIEVTGLVQQRPAGTENHNLPTGQVEVAVREARILNPSRTPPFYINEDVEIDDLLRLRYRYLDLRRERMRNNLLLRDRTVFFIRQWLHERGFIEVETPILANETPGGARSYLVPSRLQPGHFFALPQSPQQYKQLLMVAGVERYFQIARCFRDEDLRADRQPEFTQLDLEMSFVDQEDILSLVESLFIDLVPAVSDKQIATIPFPRLTYQEAMDRYGNDKPDMRFGLLLTDLTDLAAGSGFRVFENAIEANGRVKGIRAPGLAAYTRREVDELTSFVKARGAKGLITIALTSEGIKTPLSKFMSEGQVRSLVERLEGEEGDLLLIVADEPAVVAASLGDLRLEVGRRLGLMDRNKLAFAWVVEMPLLEWSAEENQWVAKHHQFTSPMDEDIPLLDTNPAAVRAKQYDVVCNGYEVGGGSIRIHQRELQAKIFQLLGMSDQEANALFGHLLEAFEYGTPPHGGIAPGIDRLVMLLAGEDNIREVIPFPKTQSGTEPMTGAPSTVSERRLRELHIRLIEEAP